MTFRHSETNAIAFDETFAVGALGPNELTTRNVTVAEPGTYVVEARLDTGATATHEFEVARADPWPAVFVTIADGELDAVTYYR